jgi:hypothetical protein
MTQTIADALNEEGQIAHARRTLLRLGKMRFEEPDSNTLTAIQSITDLDRLDQMTDRVLTASSWAEVLEAKGPSHG